MRTCWRDGATSRFVAATIACTFAWPSQAQQGVPSDTLVIWFRAAEGCPDGTSFLGQLRERGVTARLADAGDRVDFVVTLGQSNGVASGRLERQSSSGTIAIRQVEDPKCEGVASALALTLALSYDPADATNTLEAATPTAPEEAPPSPADEHAATSPTTAELREPPRETKVAPVHAQASLPSGVPPNRAMAIALGASVATWNAFREAWHVVASPFVELEAPSTFALAGATGRFALYAGAAPGAVTPANVWLLGARVDGCPIGVALGELKLHPCVALAGGMARAGSGAITDVGPWFAVEAHGRVGVDLGRIGLEGQAGVILPMTRYEVASPTMTLDETRTLGFAGALGAKYRFE